MTSQSDLKQQVALAITACEDKKAENVSILKMDKSSSAFTDYFVIASGTNPRQVQAIADEVELKLKHNGTYPNNIEGYRQAEWILLDYVDFVVHVFSEAARKLYDLERLWKNADKIGLQELQGKTSRARTSPAPVVVRRKAAKPRKSAASASISKAVRSASARAPKKTAKKKAAKKSATRPAAKKRSKRK